MGAELHRGIKSAVRACALFLVIIVVIIAFANRQNIQDYVRASNFDPSPRTLEVMSHLKATGNGERVFLASQPTIDGSQKFNEQCSGVDHSEDGHVLGCFVRDRIHLFDVTDERVSGIVEVTAAHELLHATFSRLSQGEKRALTEKLKKQYDVMSTSSPELVERMSVYNQLSNTAFANELHSVLGTEVRPLPSWLEDHYAQWFRDRGALVDKFDSFHSVFVGLQTQAEALQTEMTALRPDIEQRNLSHDAAVNQFNIDAANFRARNERFEFSSNQGEFDRLHANLSERGSALEVTLSELQADIDHYNSLRKELQDLSQVSVDLAGQLDSDLAPVTTRPEE